MFLYIIESIDIKCLDPKEIKLVSINKNNDNKIVVCSIIISCTNNNNTPIYLVSLTKTKSKGKDNKSKLINELHDFIDEYKHIFVFSYNNLKGTLFRDIRFAWRESK